MIRIKEHYSTVVREEIALGTPSFLNSFERPKVKGVTLHVSLKPFNFDPRYLVPRTMTQDFAFGSRPKISFSSLSDPDRGIRQGATVGMRSSKFNASFVYDFRDRTLWNLAGLPRYMFPGWRFRPDTANTRTIRTIIPLYEYYAMSRKDPAIKGRNHATRDWTIHLSNVSRSTPLEILATGLNLPFVGVQAQKEARRHRSKTVRKHRKKEQKKNLKKKRAN